MRCSDMIGPSLCSAWRYSHQSHPCSASSVCASPTDIKHLSSPCRFLYDNVLVPVLVVTELDSVGGNCRGKHQIGESFLLCINEEDLTSTKPIALCWKSMTEDHKSCLVCISVIENVSFILLVILIF